MWDMSKVETEADAWESLAEEVMQRKISDPGDHAFLCLYANGGRLHVVNPNRLILSRMSERIAGAIHLSNLLDPSVSNFASESNPRAWYNSGDYHSPQEWADWRMLLCLSFALECDEEGV